MSVDPDLAKKIAFAAWPALATSPHDKVMQGIRIVIDVVKALPAAGLALADAPARAPRGTRLPEDFVVEQEWLGAGADARQRHHLPAIDLSLEAERFCGYWTSKAGVGARKIDWRRAWINWALGANGKPTGMNGTPAFGGVLGSSEKADDGALDLAAKGIRSMRLTQALVDRAIADGRLTKDQARKVGF